MARKKLSKQDKKRAEAEQAEALRIEMEKQRQKQRELERERMILELKEAKERQKREKHENKLRRIQLAESNQYFGGIRDEIDKIYTEMRKQKEWKRFMRCNGLPNAYDPGDLRQYMHMWCLETDKYNRNEQNWLLHTDERTILTQNRLVANTTRINLQQQQINVGDLYAKRAKEVLGILDEIDEAIHDSFTLKKSIIRDSHQLKNEFRGKMADMMDEFSLKILSNIERDMVLDGLSIATHLYECEEFKTHLWTKRDIPQPQLSEKEREKEAKRYISIDFTTIRLNLSLPPSVKCKYGALRAMWLNYDHFSDCAPTFHPPVQSQKSMNLDVSIATRKEWKKRKELLATSDTYQEPLFEDNIGAVPFDNFETIGTTALVDVDKLYGDYVNELTAKRRRRQGPDALCLNEFEMNLRKYRIIGGIYCIEYFDQPPQHTKHSSNLYLRTITGPNTLKRRNFFQYYRAPAPVPAGVRRLPEELEAEMRAVESGMNKLAYITITLPDDVLWFEPPTVCRWETADETKASLKLESKKAEEDGQVKKKSTVTAAPSIERKRVKPTKIIEDFDLSNIPPHVDLSGLMREFFLPNMPDGYTIKMPDNSATDEPKSINSIDDILCETHSPRWLYPKREETRPLQITPKPSTDQSQPGPSTYLFSQLLRDLDELWTKQEPFFERQSDEKSEMQSMSVSEGQESPDAESEVNFKDLSFLRTATDYPSFSFLAKKEQDIAEEAKKSDEEESEEDSIELDDETVKGNSESESDDEHSPIGRWSIRDVHDPKFNEEKLAIQFRSGRLGHFGLAVNWYSNLPFQTWELKPIAKAAGQVSFSLTAAIVSIELTITSGGITLSSFQGGISSMVQNCVGTMMPFDVLCNIMKRAGINLFPDDDSFCYCEAACEKNIVMESHLYACMACLALTHNFMWSRWNVLANSCAVVLLMREVFDQKKPEPFSTLYVSTLKAYFLECVEVSTSFNTTPLLDTKFYADLYHLANDCSQSNSKEKQLGMDAVLRDNIVQVLRTIRPLSFC